MSVESDAFRWMIIDISVYADRLDLEGCFNLGRVKNIYDFTLNDGDA